MTPFPVTQSSRLAWLMATLAGKRDRLTGLLRRMAGLGTPGALAPSLFGKFLHMLNEVAVAKDEETGLISQIEAIEQKHRFLRVNKGLKRALPPKAVAYPDNEQKQPQRPAHSLLWLLVFWYLFMRRRINQKKQSLTAN